MENFLQRLAGVRFVSLHIRQEVSVLSKTIYFSLRKLCQFNLEIKDIKMTSGECWTLKYPPKKLATLIFIFCMEIPVFMTE